MSHYKRLYDEEEVVHGYRNKDKNNLQVNDVIEFKNDQWVVVRVFYSEQSSSGKSDNESFLKYKLKSVTLTQDYKNVYLHVEGNEVDNIKPLGKMTEDLTYSEQYLDGI